MINYTNITVYLCHYVDLSKQVRQTIS